MLCRVSRQVSGGSQAHVWRAQKRAVSCQKHSVTFDAASVQGLTWNFRLPCQRLTRQRQRRPWRLQLEVRHLIVSITIHTRKVKSTTNQASSGPSKQRLVSLSGEDNVQHQCS